MKDKILNVLSILFGLVFINAGLNKFFNYMPVPEDLPERVVNMFNAMMEISWLIPLIAVIEITGGILFMSKKYRAIGAIIILPVMAGIILTHFTVDPSGLPLPLVMLAILVWAMIENSEKYLPIIE